MESSVFDEIASAFAQKGSDAAIQQTLQTFEQQNDFHQAFDVMLLAARHELGLPLFGMGSASDLPEEVAQQYEKKVIEAGRKVRDAFLASGDLPTAFNYAQMIGETAPIRDALERSEPPEEQLDSWVEIAVSQNVHPGRGLKWIVDRYGTCQGITTVEQLLGQGIKPPARDACIKLLVRVLHAELLERIQSAVEEKEGKTSASLPLLLKNRDWLFADDAYFIDVSHLNAVVRMARLLPKCDETTLALQLCEYGSRLSRRYTYPEPAPFEDVFGASILFFNVINGTSVDEGLEYFRKKADSVHAENDDPYPAEVYVHLLLSCGKTEQAVLYAARKLNRPHFRSAIVPSINELLNRTGHFAELADCARRRGDLVGYLGGMLQQKSKG